MKDELILAIKRNQYYPELLKTFRELRPSVPIYDYKLNNVEEWKANSLRQEGFDLCLTALKIDLTKE